MLTNQAGTPAGALGTDHAFERLVRRHARRHDPGTVCQTVHLTAERLGGARLPRTMVPVRVERDARRGHRPVPAPLAGGSAGIRV